MNMTTDETSFETEIASLLSELSSVQDELLDVLESKRDLMAASDVDGIAQLQPREEQLLARLDVCHKQRAELLQSAEDQGLSCDSLGQLVSKLPLEDRPTLAEQVDAASSRMRLLQHQSITNWVLAQRTLLHLSQLLEIIATGGQLRPTYGTGNSPAPSGALVDQEA